MWGLWLAGDVWLNRPAQVRLRSATGDDMVSGSIVVRGWCEDKLVGLTALVATHATRSVCSATKFVSAGNRVEMKPIHSVLHYQGGGSILIASSMTRVSLSKSRAGTLLC